MSITSSMNAGVMGLATNSAKLATISDNIANSSSKGYKRADIEFSSLVLDDSKTTYVAGGVRANPLRYVDQRGAINSTRNVTDLAISGPGFLPVIDERDADSGATPALKFVTTGSFRPNSDGLLTTATGFVLMGWPAAADGTITRGALESVDGLEPVRLENLAISAVPTNAASLAANLPYGDTLGTTSTSYDFPITYYNNVGGAETLTARFTYVPNDNGTPADPTDDIAVPNTWRFDILDSASATPTTPIYTADMTFDDTPGNGGELLSFTQTVPAGTDYDPTTGDILLTMGTLQQITLNVGALGTTNGLQQLDADYAVLDFSRNGSPAANMTAIEVDGAGIISAIFDTGLTRPLYQVPIANVRNPNGMQSQDGQAFKVTAESGSFFFYEAGTGPVGLMVSSALEESTTDIAEELTQMIRTQRAYSSNAKIIQTADEMLQETTNLKR